ncbi:hypothetical protein GW17_00028887 [Ensete ventricosum]|nr:hypothetical protein GW17_00028887 [Ensete ventricosum]
MGGTYWYARLSVRGLLAIGRYHQKSIVGSRLREKLTVSSRLREKSTVGGRLRKKKNKKRRKKKKRINHSASPSPVACARGEKGMGRKIEGHCLFPRHCLFAIVMLQGHCLGITTVLPLCHYDDAAAASSDTATALLLLLFFLLLLPFSFFLIYSSTCPSSSPSFSSSLKHRYALVTGILFQQIVETGPVPESTNPTSNDSRCSLRPLYHFLFFLYFPRWFSVRL